MSGTPLGQCPPHVVTPPPGAASRAWVDRLARAECPAFTARRARRAETAGASADPIVWHAARGANVSDVDGNVYVDLTSGFGVAAIGHGHPRWRRTVREQLERLPHALGDLHPSDTKIALLERLCALAPWTARAVLGLNGSDAIETALKTAALATGRAGVLAFEGGYHGLAYGPLAACGYQEGFRVPFLAQLNPHVHFAPWGCVPEPFPEVGAVLVEPIQGRGGVRMPPEGFLRALSEAARAAGALVIVDEIFTGLGRCGEIWLHQALGLDADLVCIGKALGGGLPVSACLGRESVMAAWGTSDKEAIHTGTFYGHPLGAAAALETLAILEEETLALRARELGDTLAAGLRAQGLHVRGAGLMLGVEMESSVLGLVADLMGAGYLTLPAGEEARVLQLVPPLTIDADLLVGFVDALSHVLSHGSRRG